MKGNRDAAMLLLHLLLAAGMPVERLARQAVDGRRQPVLEIASGHMITRSNGRLPGPIDGLTPFPEGWYFIASRKSILREKLIEKTWEGEEIVDWRQSP